jgi:hypothetical protein
MPNQGALSGSVPCRVSKMLWERLPNPSRTASYGRTSLLGRAEGMRQCQDDQRPLPESDKETMVFDCLVSALPGGSPIRKDFGKKGNLCRHAVMA